LTQVFPTLLDGEGRELRNGVCVNLTLPQTLDLLKNANWPGRADGHTHDVGCSMGLTLALTLMNPPKHSWHGPSSFCAWWTGALAFVDGADDPYQLVSCLKLQLFFGWISCLLFLAFGSSNALFLTVFHTMNQHGMLSHVNRAGWPAMWASGGHPHSQRLNR
jgi:hypothetical protein